MTVSAGSSQLPIPYLDVRGDFHVHSIFSDDATSTIEHNLAAGERAGLTDIRLTDHVRSTTTWVPEFLAEVVRARTTSKLRVHCGVETKLLDVRGTLDLPPDVALNGGLGDPDGLGAIVIGDHQFPGTDGPWSPSATRERLDSGLSAGDALDLYIESSINAMERTPGVQLGHWFSILPKVGLSEEHLTDEHLERWAEAAARTGTLVEVNEKWRCPGERAIRVALEAGVHMVLSTDSHQAENIAKYNWVLATLVQVRKAP